MLQQGQVLCLGDVELFVESVEVRVAIPKLEVPRAAPPRRDGSSAAAAVAAHRRADSRGRPLPEPRAHAGRAASPDAIRPAA